MKNFQSSKNKYLFLFATLMVTGMVVFWGCQSVKPLAPTKNVALTVSIPQSSEVQASLLGVATNEVLYRVDGSGLSPAIKGTAGPFSTASNTGTVDIQVNVPDMDSLILSLQLNDASTHQPLAIGAVPLNLITNPAADVVVDMGSVARNCYTLNVPGTGNYINPDFFTFSTDGLFGNAAGSLGDIQLNYGVGSAAPLTITGRPVSAYGAPMTTVAYLGNGNFVDYDSIPPVSAFKTDSSLAKGAPISVDDIFCINLNPGHAWVQVTAVGNGSLNQGPSFRYRINSLLPYYGYEQTNADLGKGATCSTIW